MKAFIFILLKIVEIAAIIFVPYFLGLIYSAVVNKELPVIVSWGTGFLIFWVICLFGFIVGFLISMNLDLSEKLTKILKKKLR